MTREVEGRRRRPRVMMVLVTVVGLVLAGLTAGMIGTASAAPTEPGRGGPLLAEGTPCTAAARACVDLANSTAWLIRDGRIEAGPVPASFGKKGQRTPAGVFQVQWKNKDHRSAEFNNAPMPFAVFFAPGGIAFHEGNTETESAGCVRLSRADAERWFTSLQVGDRVEVTNIPR
ncbi:L,D-transpeptidase [Pseudonocardia sp. ICBG1293]|uniref:L,D-transpeptidase n=1 Tax=Pseudonocardia sp. ICBG1293 TaxID=2844382 RepID=UPI001CC9D020|nr:L,D-transpeptidase [Pseudonocardia sp. ICBG1293]